jgi:hypothetical protein
MLRHASWTHGNSLTVETPQNLDSIFHHGWGIDLFFIPGKASWCHIPIPTPVIVNDQRTKVQKLFLLFECLERDGSITNIHIFDGPFKVQEFNNLSRGGEHRARLDNINTITLQNPRVVKFGISITFRYQAAIGIDTNIPPPLLMVSSAGADFF